MISLQALGLLLTLGAATQSTALASDTPFEALREQVAKLRSSVPADVKAAVLTEVGSMGICASAPRPAVSDFGWIYNTVCAWGYSEVNGERCIYLLEPEVRLLTKEEAFDLLLASRSPIPPPPGYEDQPPPPIDIDVHFVGDDMPRLIPGQSGEQLPLPPSIGLLRGNPSDSNVPSDWVDSSRRMRSGTLIHAGDALFSDGFD